MPVKRVKGKETYFRTSSRLRYRGLFNQMVSGTLDQIPKTRLKKGSGFFKLLVRPPLILRVRRPGNAYSAVDEALLYDKIFNEHNKRYRDPTHYRLKRMKIHFAVPEYYVREFVDRPTIESLIEPLSRGEADFGAYGRFLKENPGFSKEKLNDAYVEWLRNMMDISNKTGVWLALNQEDVFVHSYNPKTGKFTFIMREIILPKREN